MNEKKKQMPPADDFGGYPGDGVDGDQDDDQDDDRGDGGRAHIDPAWDIDLDRPPTKGERRIIELTLREVGAAMMHAGGDELLRELVERTEGMVERVAQTLHDGVDEVFTTLIAGHDESDSGARMATTKAREEAHRTVDQLAKDLRGEGDNETG